MRSSTLVLAALSALAIAAPVEKRVYVTDITTAFVTVTVTEGQERPTLRPHAQHGQKGQAPKSAAPVVVAPTPTPVPETTVVATYAAVPTKPAAAVVMQNAPEPTPVAVDITTSAPAPAETTEAPVEVPAPTTEAAAPTTEAATSPPATTDTPSFSDYKGAVLYHHNIHRANHSSPDLTYDTDLASYAATVAATCKFGHDITVGGGGYGQNIAMSGSTGPTESAKDASVLAGGVISNMWYNSELPLYMPRFSGIIPATDDFMSWGHFSQVVWKGTSSVGCATQYCEAGTDMFSGDSSGWYTVCNYKSAGNMGGAYDTNVLPPLGNPTVSG